MCGGEKVGKRELFLQFFEMKNDTIKFKGRLRERVFKHVKGPLLKKWAVPSVINEETQKRIWVPEYKKKSVKMMKFVYFSRGLRNVLDDF